MHNSSQTAAETVPSRNEKTSRAITLERFAILYARIALGVAFLSAVADRFGLWGKYGGWGNFANFTKYTAEVNSFMPESHHSVSCLGSYDCRTLAWHPVNPGPLDALGSPQHCYSAFSFRNGHGHFLWPQISVGLFSLLRIRRSLVAGAVPWPEFGGRS